MRAWHQELAGGRWAELSLVEQMAHIGSEVERALNWRAKGRPAYAWRAFERSLELFDLTLEHCASATRLREVARAREEWVGHFLDEGERSTSEQAIRRYFVQFACAARIHTT